MKASLAIQSDDAKITAAMALVSRVPDGAALEVNVKENVAAILFETGR